MKYFIPTIFFVLFNSVCGVVAAEETAATETQTQPVVFAKVGDQTINQKTFEDAYARAARSRFYHGKPPEGDLEKVRQEVVEQLVTRVLLLQEAHRLGLTPDNLAIQQKLDGYDQRYGNSPRWLEQRDQMLSAVKQKLEEDDLLNQIESRVRRIAPPDDSEVFAYFQANRDKFTEPAQQQVSVILLQVDPSSSADVWDAAMIEAQGLVTEINQGATFEELARLRSSDRSADAGGDMGYLHQGMLSPAAQEVVDKLEINEISEPVRLLRGIGIFKVTDRKSARKRDFDDVKKRARDLAIREKSERAWTSLKERLRSSTPVVIYNEEVPMAYR